MSMLTLLKLNGYNLKASRRAGVKNDETSILKLFLIVTTLFAIFITEIIVS